MPAKISSLKLHIGGGYVRVASPAYIITRRLFGIEPLEPAFRKVQVRPRPGGLEYAEIKSPTIRGPVFYYEGTIQKEPEGRPLRMGALTCQIHYGFPL